MLFLEQNGYQESGGRITMVKIYGTLGPACQDEKILTEMFALGMTGMRLNLSHVTLAESGELIGKMKWAAESCGVKPQLLIDLQGPELRTGAVAEPILLKNEEIVEICAAADWKTENERNDRCGDMDLIRSATDQKDQKVVEFLEKNNYFGYDKNFVTIFTQSELPLVDEQGKLLIGKDFKIKEASDGNGGTYSSLRASGCLSDMKEKGIKWVFIGSVDNALLKMVDVTLLGMAKDKNVQIASKSVVKANPHERVGVFCKMNGHPKVIEYTELPEHMAEERDEDGELKYGESHIMCNLYTIEAIEKISKEILMYHSAHKKNSYIDENGNEVIPVEPNSYKFESFIFDAFEFFDDIAILRGKREDDFAPVKNKEGADSPKTAKELYEKFWNKSKIKVSL